MNQITRYEVRTIASNDGLNCASMEQDEHGAYVTHEAHAEKMLAAQARIEALELMQKRDFFYHLQKGLGKVAEQAIEEVVKELVRKATQTVFKVNPCHDLTAEMVDDLVKRMRHSSEFATGGLVTGINEPETVGCVVRHGQVFIGDAVIKSGHVQSFADESGQIKSVIVNNPEIRDAVSHNPANTSSKYNITLGVKVDAPEMACRQLLPMQETCGLMCVKSDVDYFTAGERYSYGYELCGGSKIWFVSGDNYVSDLAVEDRWTLEDGGAYMYVKNEITGQCSAVFKKP